MKLDFSKKVIIGMVHLKPLINSAGYLNNDEAILKQALADAKILAKGGVDAIMIENMHDSPLKEKLGFEQALQLMHLATLIKEAVNLPLGIDAAFNDYETSLAIAKIVGAQFVRIAVFVDTVLFHGGIIMPAAPQALEYRKYLGGEEIKILADIQVKYTDMLVPVPIENSAKRAEAALADGVIVTGTASGEATPLQLIKQVKRVVSIPVLIGSGVNSSNIKEGFKVADGAIVGSSLKEHQLLEANVSLRLTKRLVNQVRGVNYDASS